MHRHKHERFLINLLVERTSFVYNIILSNQFNITKKYKKKCINLLVEIQTYFKNIKYQNYDTKDVNYQYKQYRSLMNRLDYLMKSFDDNIGESEKIKQIWTKNLSFYISRTIDMIFLNPNYDEKYFSDFAEYIIHITINKYLLTRDSNDLIYYNKFYLL